MVRRYGDPVVVRPASGAPPASGFSPGVFLWRGRLYVVQEVLGHWRERRAWWSAAAARVVHGEGEPGAVAVADRASTTARALDAEREVWRVEASRGRAFGSGVFDLCRDRPVAPDDPGPVAGRAARAPDGDDAWRLLRVND